jgi:hypothetical protein
MNQQPRNHGLRSSRFLIAGVALLLVILLGWWIASPRILTQEYASFVRLDGNYRVIVLRTSVWPALMPGQAGDAPGRVRLYDKHGKLLHEAKVEMVQLVDHVDWADQKVRIKFVAEWDLPD